MVHDAKLSLGWARGFGEGHNRLPFINFRRTCNMQEKLFIQ